MPLEERHYGCNTYLRLWMPWSTYLGGRIMCSDGKVRTLNRISTTADTYFSVRAQVKVDKKTVAGYVTFETAQGLSTPMPDDPVVAKFVRNEWGKNAALLPAGTWCGEATKQAA